jgi:hypothetical protein
MSMEDDRILSTDELGEVVSTLARVAKRQQYDCDELLRKLETAVNAFESRTDELLRKHETAVTAFESRTTELIRDMPEQIAPRAAEKVIRDIAGLVEHKVANVLQPAEAKVQTLLKEMKDEVVECRRAATEYRRAATENRRARWNAVLTCIIASVFGVLVILVISTFWRS